MAEVIKLEKVKDVIALMEKVKTILKSQTIYSRTLCLNIEAYYQAVTDTKREQNQ